MVQNTKGWWSRNIFNGVIKPVGSLAFLYVVIPHAYPQLAHFLGHKSLDVTLLPGACCSSLTQRKVDL